VYASGDANRVSCSGWTPAVRPHSEQNLAEVESAAPQCPQDRARNAPHSSQNLACGRFSRWHRGQGMSNVSRVRISSRRPRSPVTGPREPPELGVPAAPAARQPDPTASRPRAPDGRFRPGLAQKPFGGPRPAAPTGQNLRPRHAPDSYTPSGSPDPDSLEAPPEPADSDAVAPPRDRALARLAHGSAGCRPYRSPKPRPILWSERPCAFDRPKPTGKR
jgi:hypothetical protein